MTVSLAAPRTANAGAFFSIFDAEDRIVAAAVGAPEAIRILHRHGATIGEAIAALTTAARRSLAAV